MDLLLAPKRKRAKKAAAADDDDASLANDGVLPTDVLRAVLLRLPAKELCRLRLVCRSWRSLTSDPTFVQAHTSRHPLFVGLVSLQKGANKINIVDLRGNVIRRASVPDGCYDLTTQLDVVCASAFVHGLSFVLEIGSRDHRLSTLSSEFDRRCQFSFPSILGYVPSTGEYKVLGFRLVRATNNGYLQPCHVVTLNRDDDDGRRWRVAPCPAVPIEPASENRAVIDGVAYFLLHAFYTKRSTNLEPDSIACFHLELEEWKPKPLRGPVSSLIGTGDDNDFSYRKHRRDFQLTELSGNLVVVHRKHQDCSMDIWVLADADNCICSKRFSVQCAQDWVHRGRSLYPLVILDDGRIVMSIGVARFMRAYDPRTSAWSTVVDTEEMYVAVSAYVGSLL